MVIKYTSENGYTGMLYGESSIVIYDPDGNLVFQTGCRTINTETELKAEVDSWPDKSQRLLDFYKKMSEREER